MRLKMLLTAASIVDLFNQDLYRKIVRRLLIRRGIKVRGLPLWISPTVYFDCKGGITLGDRCAVTVGALLLTHDFALDRVGERRLGITDKELVRRAPIEIGDQAFIGMRAIILPGVKIGNGAIVAAGSVVTKDVPADTVVAGNPAQIVYGTETYWERSLSKYEWQPRRS